MSRDMTLWNTEFQGTLFQTERWALHPEVFHIWMQFHRVVPLENKCCWWEGSGSTHSGTGRDPAGRSSQSRHKDKAPSCAGMTETGQHKTVPNSPWQHYGCHEHRPSVIYMHVFTYLSLMFMPLIYPLSRRGGADRCGEVNFIWPQRHMTGVLCYVLRVIGHLCGNSKATQGSSRVRMVSNLSATEGNSLTSYTQWLHIVHLLTKRTSEGQWVAGTGV